MSNDQPADDVLHTFGTSTLLGVCVILLVQVLLRFMYGIIAYLPFVQSEINYEVNETCV